MITNAQSKTVRCPWADCGAPVHFTAAASPRRFPYLQKGRCEADHPVVLTFVAFGIPPGVHADRAAPSPPSAP